MVSDALHLDAQITQSQQTTKNEKEEEEDDNSSVCTTSTDECHQEGAVVLQDTEDRVPYFGNVEVKNSSDVHFGNKTYYQGPVTIKQILYSNRDGEQTDSNGAPPQLAIDNKCVIDGVNSDSGYRTDSVHPLSNGHAKTPNGTSNITRGEKWPEYVNKKALIITAVVMAVVVIVTIGLVVGLAIEPAKPFSHTTPNPMLTDPDAMGDVLVIPRIEWVATDPLSTIPLHRPVPNVIIFESRTESCNEKRECIRIVRHLQNSDIEGKGHSDIQFNFLVGGDGNAYNGRGWTTESVIAPNCNAHSISIALIGTFSEKSPTKAQVIATKRLIAKGLRKGHISNDSRLVAASQILGGNEGAGRKLLEEVKNWPIWASPDYSKNITMKESFCKGE